MNKLVLKVHLMALILLSVVGTAKAEESLQRRLFEGIYACDIDMVQSSLEFGADANRPLTSEESKGSRFNSINTPLASAIWTHCPQIADIPKIEDKLEFTKGRILKLIDLLMAKGADPYHLLDTPHGLAPLLHIPFYDRMGFALAIPYFKQMVLNGADPNYIGVLGFNALSGIQMTQVDVSLIKDLLDLGLSYNHPTKFGYSHAPFFPHYEASEEQIKAMIPVLQQSGFDYRTGDYSEHEGFHPLVREFMRFVKPLNARSPDMKKRMIFFKNIFLPFTRDVLDFPSGTLGLLPIVHFMVYACPTTEFKDHLYYSFEPANMRWYESPSEQQLYGAYQFLLELIRDGDFDYRIKDQHGINPFTYALNLCPVELVQEILNKTEFEVDQEQLRLAYNLIPQLKKVYGRTSFLNNDHRTYKFLKGKGVLLDFVDTFEANITNPYILQGLEPAKLQWKSLEDVGLNSQTVLQVRGETQFLFHRYTDLKTTNFHLDSISGLSTFKFTGIPISVSLYSSKDSSHQHGLTVFRDHKGLDFKVIDGVLHYQFLGGFQHSGQLHISQMYPGQDVILAVVETKSPKFEKVNRPFQEEITLKRDKPYLLTKKSDPLLWDLTYTYVGAIPRVFCEKIICRYLQFDQLGADYQVSVDEKRLNAEDSALYTVWEYLNTSLESRKELLKKLARSPEPGTLAYFPDLVNLEPTSALLENEAIFLLDLLLNMEFSGKLPFPIGALKDKLYKFKPISERGRAFFELRKFLLGSDTEDLAFKAISSTFSHLEEFILLGTGVPFKGVYKANYIKLSSKILQDLDSIAKRLQLTPEQITIIQGNLK